MIVEHYNIKDIMDRSLLLIVIQQLALRVESTNKGIVITIKPDKDGYIHVEFSDTKKE